MVEDVEPGAFLVADDYGHRILELFAEANVEHASVERAAPHAHIEPARARKRSRHGAGENQIGGSGKHASSNWALYSASMRQKGFPPLITNQHLYLPIGIPMLFKTAFITLLIYYI